LLAADEYAFSQVSYERFLFDSTQTYTVTVKDGQVLIGKFISRNGSSIIFQTTSSVIIEIPVLLITKINVAEKPQSLFSNFPEDTTFHKPTIFVYNNREATVVADVGFGIGHGAEAGQAGVSFNVDAYHILFGASVTSNGFGLIGQSYLIRQTSFVAGYRFRTRPILLSLASGYGRQKFRCTSGLNSNCYNYVEESISAVPLIFQFDIVLGNNVALGLNINHMYSQRQPISGFMINIKFGNFREY
jgi:hypothetical protein